MDHDEHDPSRGTVHGDANRDALLHIVRELTLELHPGRARSLRVRPESRLDRDLGFDSLSRVELLLRVNAAFDVDLPESVLGNADTVDDLLTAVAEAGPTADVQPAYQPSSLTETDAPPADIGTLNTLLEWHVESHAERPHVYLYGDAPEPEVIGYGDLFEGARSIAAGIQRLRVRRGQHLALMLPTSRDYLECFFGILLAGCVPVPIYPPARPSQIEDHLRRHARLLANAEAVVLITVPEARAVARLLQAQVPGLHQVVTPDDVHGAPDDALVVQPSSDDVAFLQYTSGSTGDPKGVVLRHSDLLANIHAMGQTIEATSRDVFVSWLPLYHDMGLIGAWFGSLCYAMPLVLMSPLAFLTGPDRWLRRIEQHRGTISAAPNFRYELGLKRLDDDTIDALDLSSWRLAFNGAEPVSPHTVRRFTERFARAGFRAEAMTPVYGLAEAAVGLAFPPLDRGPHIDRVTRDALVVEGQARPASGGDEHLLEFVSSGRPLPGYEIRIVDDADRELPDRTQGRVQFLGPSATRGYYRNEAATRQLYHGNWLDSGDLGYIAAGELYLTSRAKDVIIRGGRNVHPYELEEAIGQLDDVRAGCVAVFGSTDPASGTERVIVVAETRTRDATAHEGLITRINDIANDILGMPPDDIVPVPPHSVLKTSSGKIRRTAMRERYESGSLAKPPPSVPLQILHVLTASARARWHQARRGLRRLGYAGYVHVLFWILAPLTWLAVALCPQPRRCWRIARFAARSLFRLARVPLHIDGLEHLDATRPAVLTANHASYLDGVLLVAALPEPAAFVAKAELAPQRIAGTFLRRLGTVFVERFDHELGLAGARQATGVLEQGGSLLFFPEGTLTRMPGLLPFHMGAFSAAAEANVPVVPITIRGTRSVLRVDTRFPHHHPISVSVGSPIRPQGRGWQAMVDLRERTRRAMLDALDEPDLSSAPAAYMPAPT